MTVEANAYTVVKQVSENSPSHEFEEWAVVDGLRNRITHSLLFTFNAINDM